MYINRITFSLSKNYYTDGILVQFTDEQLKRFNQTTDFLEELLHHHLPKKTNLGGFGFFNNKIESEKPMESIKSYGQCIYFYHYLEVSEIQEICNLQLNILLNKITKLLKNAINEISKIYTVDKDIFLSAIADLPNSYAGIEQKMKVSKSHVSRKIRVEVIRKVEFLNENIIYRIVDRKDKILIELVLEKNTSIYDCSYSYKKSKWNENSLEIFDRFDRIHKTINTDEYIK